jgi:Asp-tRNA(Asn)/Glu-tRNA(Gln) amidotransferase A subunit family amidase
MAVQLPDGPRTVTAAAALLRDGALSTVELMDQVITRLEATEARVHAYVWHDLDRARDEAKRLARVRPRGPLHGIPFGVKDVFAAAGTPTACGSRALAEHAPVPDAVVVARLRAAGAIMIGKHVTHELTCGLDCPATRSLDNPSHYPGGSSTGSGVAVAVGSAMFALGTDSAGSVRNPGSVNGIVGLKPTHGRLSTVGVARAATAPSIDHVGILARTTADAALILEALAPGTLGPPPHSGPPPSGLADARLGVLHAGALSAPDREVTTLVDAALAELAERGATLIPVDVPALGDTARTIATLFAAELAAGNRALLTSRHADYHPAVRHLLEDGLSLSASQLSDAERSRARIRAALDLVMIEHRLDVLVSPTLPTPPPPLSGYRPAEHLAALTTWTAPFNLTGQPAISTPCGVTAAGLPVGLHIAGARGAEDTVLRIASAITAPDHP